MLVFSIWQEDSEVEAGYKRLGRTTGSAGVPLGAPRPRYSGTTASAPSGSANGTYADASQAARPGQALIDSVAGQAAQRQPRRQVWRQNSLIRPGSGKRLAPRHHSCEGGRRRGSFR
eukprot:13275427-Alexandrium_andersonii.AAC.1